MNGKVLLPNNSFARRFFPPVSMAIAAIFGLDASSLFCQTAEPIRSLSFPVAAAHPLGTERRQGQTDINCIRFPLGRADNRFFVLFCS